MKRFSKIKNKKGFTLLETLLATCILVIIGSMLMEGFITSMGYSYNSSVYAKSAAYNSKLCVDQLADWSMKADGVASYSGGTITPEDRPYADVGTIGYNQTAGYTNLKQIVFTGNLGTIRVAVHEEKDVKTTGSSSTNLSDFTAETIKNNPNAVADNRVILFYYPTNNGPVTDTTHFGATCVYRKSDGTLVWGYDDATQPNGVKILGTKTKLVAPSN